VRYLLHTTLFAIKGSNNKKTNKTKKKKRNKTLQDYPNILRLSVAMACFAGRQ